MSAIKVDLPVTKGTMNWVRCRIESVHIEHLEKPDVDNYMINLDAVIHFYKQKDAKHDPPRFYVITFECVDGKNRYWYFLNKSDMITTYDGIKDYINKKSAAV